MKATVRWTVNDFPAYANVSVWSTKGKLACPCCNKETSSRRLKNGSKLCYMGHRQFLLEDHLWRDQKMQFDRKIYKKVAPKHQEGDEVLNELEGLRPITFEKAGKKQVIAGFGKKHNIFFQLPYWKTLLLRHCLDVMHIEKNICDNVLGIIMNIKGKSKDSLNARLDLKEMRIRQELHPIEVDREIMLPPACYTLTNDEKKSVFQWLSDIKVPDGYSANLSRCVNVKDGKISSMKTHDCHLFLERQLPLLVCDILPKHVYDALMELSNFCRELCAKVLKEDELDRLETQIVVTLCKLEKTFPPAFFDIKIHLPIHLAWETKVAGPVQYRWMYPIER